MHVIFETERLVVRRYDEGDLDHVFRLNGDEEVMRYIRKTLTRDEAAVFLTDNIAFYTKRPGLGRWAVEDRNGVFVGSFALIPIGSTVDIQLGYALLKPYWGKGFASELTAAGIEHALAAGIDPLFGITEEGNDASRRVLEKHGFKYRYSTEEQGKTLHRFQYERP